MNESITKKNSTYEKLTPQRKVLVDLILHNLENGTGLWKKGWKASGLPVSGITGKPYRGVNNVFLTIVAMTKHYEDNRWVTFHQMQERDWHFKTDEEGNSLGKGAGVSVEYFEFRDRETKKPFDKEVLNGLTTEEKEEYIRDNVYPLRKYYIVFNGDLIEGIPKKEQHEVDESTKNERAEHIIQFWNTTEAPIIYGGNEAFYLPSTDEIHLPKRENFYSLQEYYSTALHEIGHSTGHEKRLNRDLSGEFGSEKYAEEELRAEIASLFIEQDLGISVSENHIENNSAYIGYWQTQIKENPNILFTSIADAERIAQFVMHKEKALQEVSVATLDQPNTKQPEQREVQEQPSDVYSKPSEMVRLVQKTAIVDRLNQGVDSLTKMGDREIVERASKTKYGQKFVKLYRGEAVLGNQEKDERSLMARLAMFCPQDKEQLLRIFCSSGQYRKEKTMAFYDNMADQTLQWMATLKENPVPITDQTHGQQHFGMSAKR